MNTRSRKAAKSTQSRKRRSGNSKDSPSRVQSQVSAGYLFRRVAREQVPIEIDGTRVMMSRWETYTRQIYMMALNKNNGAARLLEQLRKQFPGDLLPGDPIYFSITEEDAKL